MAQFAGYAFFLAHLSTPLFEKGQVVASPVLLDAITARLQAQLEAHRVMLETGMSITVPFNSPEQAALPRGTPSGPGRPGVVNGTSVLVPLHQWVSGGSDRQRANITAQTHIPIPSNNPTPSYAVDPNELLSNYVLTNHILAMADFLNFQLVVLSNTCAALIPKYGPIIVPSTKPPTQPRGHHLDLLKAELALSQDLENAPEWRYIFQRTSSHHQSDLFSFSPGCTDVLLKHYLEAQMYLVGVGKLRTAMEISRQPEDVIYFVGEVSLLSRRLGSLEHVPAALTEAQLFDRRRIQCEWAENLFLGLVTHLQQNPATRLDWGDLANTEELEKLLISHPFEPKYQNIPFATKHVHSLLTIALLAGPFNIQSGMYPLFKSRVGAASIIPPEVLANLLTVFSWALGLALTEGNPDYPTYLAYRQLPGTHHLYDFYLKVAQAVERLGLYQRFIDQCIADASEERTREMILELCARGLLRNPGAYLTWYGIQL